MVSSNSDDLRRRLRSLSPEQRRRLSALVLDHSRGDQEPASPSASDSFPASAAQRTLWHLAVDQQDSAYTLTSRFTVSGPLQPAALVEAVDGLRRTHQALRLTLEETEEGLRSIDRGIGADAVTVVDLRGLTSPSQSAVIDSHRPAIDVAAGRVIEVAAFSLADREWELVLSLHHLVYDEWSLTVLVSDLALAYGQVCTGNPIQLESATGYGAHAEAERIALGGSAGEDAANWWSDRLAGALPTHLPEDRSLASDGQAVATAVRSIPLEPVDERCRLLASPRGSVILSSIGRVIARWCGAQQATLSVPVTNRSGPGLERTVGNLTNAVPVTVPLVEDAARSAHEVRNQVLEHSRHSMAPLGSLMANGSVVGPSVESLTSVLCLISSASPELHLHDLRVVSGDAGPAARLAPVVIEIDQLESSMELRVHIDSLRYLLSTGEQLAEQIATELLGQEPESSVPVGEASFSHHRWSAKVEELLGSAGESIVASEGSLQLSRPRSARSG